MWAKNELFRDYCLVVALGLVVFERLFKASQGGLERTPPESSHGFPQEPRFPKAQGHEMS